MNFCPYRAALIITSANYNLRFPSWIVALNRYSPTSQSAQNSLFYPELIASTCAAREQSPEESSSEGSLWNVPVQNPCPPSSLCTLGNERQRCSRLDCSCQSAARHQQLLIGRSHDVQQRPTQKREKEEAAGHTPAPVSFSSSLLCLLLLCFHSSRFHLFI